MTNYVRGVEWLDRAADSRYPLNPAATGLDNQSVFDIPNGLLLELYIAVPADLLIKPGYVWVSRILHTSSLVSIYLSADINNELVEIGRFDISQLAVRAQALRVGYGMSTFSGAVGFEDLRGWVVVGSLDSLALQPQGEFTFTFEAAGLDPDCIRPHIRHVSHLDVELTGGDVRLDGALRLAAGNNMRMRVETEDGEPVVYLDAIDPTNLNSDLQCDYGVSPPIRFVNGLPGGASREITLLGSRCLEVQPAGSQLQLTNRCSEPCATCAESEALQALIAPFAQQIPTLVNLANRLEIAVLQTQANVTNSQTGGGTPCSEPEAP